MAKLEELQWRGEPLRAKIYFTDTEVYEVYTDTSYTEPRSSSFIKQASFRLSEGNNNVNPLGISSSNTVSLQIYDENDYLTPTNTDSPYYNYLVSGIRMDIEISYNGTVFEPFGTWYITSWGGGFSDGWHSLVTVGASDRLNTIGSLDLPLLRAYSNVQASVLIGAVMNGIGISGSEYTIDSRINSSLMYGVAQGTKVRDFLNNICQLLFARVIVDMNGIIRFVPALETYLNGNELDLTPDNTGSLSSKTNSNINYNKLKVVYLEAGETTRETIINDNSHQLIKGANLITDITFSKKVLSVETVETIYEQTDDNAEVTDITFAAYQDGIQLNITAANGPINSLTIYGTGMVASTTERNVELDLVDASVIGGSTFSFDTKQMMTKADAQQIANKLKQYLIKMSKNIILQGTVLTPKLFTGDTINIGGTGTSYDGSYKVTAIELTMGENYSSNVTLIRL